MGKRRKESKEKANDRRVLVAEMDSKPVENLFLKGIKINLRYDAELAINYDFDLRFFSYVACDGPLEAEIFAAGE